MTRDNKYNEYRSRWRAITFNYNVIEAQEELSPTMHCLSATTRMLLTSMLPYLAWPTRYDGENMDTDKIQSWCEVATDELGGYMIRQNPANPCQMQMSCDGVTWTTVMDYSNCISPVTPTEAASWDAVIEANAATYAGDMSNLTDKWDYDGTYSDHQTNDAMCWAIHEYVRMVCAAQVIEINSANEEKNFFQSLGGYMGLASGVAGLMAAVGVFVTTAATGGAALALGAIILAMAGEYDDEDAALYEDEDTIDSLTCEILTQMLDTKPTFAAWNTALTGDTSEPVNDYVYDTMQSEDLYMQFLFLVSDMVVAAESYELECPCWDMIERLSGDGNDDMTALPYPLASPYDTTCTYLPDPDDRYTASLDTGTPSTYRLMNVEFDLLEVMEINSIFFNASVHMRRADSAHVKIFLDDVEIYDHTPVLTGQPVWLSDTIDSPGTGQVIRFEALIPVTVTGTGGIDLHKLIVGQ